MNTLANRHKSLFSRILKSYYFSFKLYMKIK